MKIKPYDNGFIILPETEFEESIIGTKANLNLEAFIKHDSSMSEIVGIVVRPKK